MATLVPLPLTATMQRLSGPRRMMLLAAALVGVAAIVLIWSWASAPTWVTLYSGLALDEAGQIDDALTRAGIQHRLGAGGSEVQIEATGLATARVLLARDGLPVGGGGRGGARKGFELFDDKQSWGMTEFDQRVTYQRALEGELARTIGSIDGVQRAQVHLVLPAPSAIRRTDHAEASVVLSLRGGVSLSPATVQGITYIVSNSVEQLAADQVAVMDDRGRLLSLPSDQGTGFGLTTRQLEIQQQLEDHLATKAERLLATIDGFGNARVTVSAQLNFDQVDRTVETFDPDRQVLASEQRSEIEAGADPSAGGAQTVIANSYQNSRVLERIARSGGGVIRMTVAVLLDQRALAADTTAPAGATGRLAEVERLVGSALGVDSTRGDRISVTAIPFRVPVVDTATPVPPPAQLVPTLERFLRPGLGLLAIVAVVIMILRLIKTGATAMPALGGLSAPSHAPMIPAREPPPLAPPSETVLLKNKVLEEATARPELAAQGIRAWMAEG